MAKRQTISKKIRFELFKRDSFQCQYCGRSAPDVILEPDHINPVSNGGDNELINLITSCFDCNRGKGANLLNDKSVIDKQRKQLQELNERRNQLEMMLAWRESLKDLDEQQIDIICSTWHEACEKRSSLNELGRHEVRKLLKKYQIAQILDAIDIVKTSYISRIVWGGDDQNEKTSHAFYKVGGVLKINSRPESERRLYYIRGILRNRMYVNEANIMRIMKDAVESGVDIEEIEDLAKTEKNWTNFTTQLYLMSEREANYGAR